MNDTFLTADWHVDLPTMPSVHVRSMIDDVGKVCDAMIKHAATYETPPNLYVLGDVTDNRKPTPATIDMLLHLFKRLKSTFARVVVIAGNHDGDAMALLEHVGVEVIGQVTAAGNHVFIPHRDDGLESVTADMQKALAAVKDAIVFGHYEVAGAVAGAESGMIARKALVLPMMKMQRAYLGHIHKPQACINGKAVYVGSAGRVDFAERDEQKGYGVLHADGAYDFVPVDVQEMVQLNVSKSTITQAQLAKLRGKVVKVIYTSADVDKPTVRAAINNVGYVRIEDTAIESAAPEVADAVSVTATADLLTTALTKWIDENVKEPTLRAQVFNQCHSYLQGDALAVGAGREIVISTLKLENYAQYADAELEIGAGLWGIIGKTDGDNEQSNGAGKSLLVDSILLALFDYTRVSKDETIRDGAEGYSVCMHFRIGQQSARVQRAYGATGSTATLEVDGKKVATGQAVTKYIEELLGVNEDAFINTCYFMQDAADAFTKSTDAVRLDKLRTYLNLDGIDKALKRIKADASGIVRELESLNSNIALTITDIGALPKLTIDAAKKSLKDAAERVKELDDEKADLRKEREAYSKLQKEYTQYTTLTAELTKLREQYKETKAALKELAGVSAGQYDDDLKAKRVILDSERGALAACAAAVKAAQTELAKASKLCSSPQCPLDLKCPHLDDPAFRKKAAAARDEIRETIAAYEKDGGKIAARVSAAERAVQAIEKSIREVREIAAMKSQLEGELESVQARAEKLKTQLTGLHTESVEKDIDRIDKRLMDTLPEELDELNKAKSDASAFIKSYDTLTARKKELQATLKVKEKQVRISEYSIAALSRDGFCVGFMGASMAYINAEANTLLEQLGADYKIELDITAARGTVGLSILIVRDGRKRGYMTYSGAQKSLITIVLRLAIYKLLALRGFVSSFMVLDEVLGKMDEANKRKFIGLIVELGKQFKQVLCISHTSVREVLPRIIEVSKSNGVSSVKVL
jgi:DNA repair exonuclease SbcCD ATPase subunit/DNA repair exonuclease SbcCD nuclease subunit